MRHCVPPPFQQLIVDTVQSINSFGGGPKLIIRSPLDGWMDLCAFDACLLFDAWVLQNADFDDNRLEQLFQCIVIIVRLKFMSPNAYGVQSAIDALDKYLDCFLARHDYASVVFSRVPTVSKFPVYLPPTTFAAALIVKETVPVPWPMTTDAVLERPLRIWNALVCDYSSIWHSQDFLWKLVQWERKYYIDQLLEFVDQRDICQTIADFFPMFYSNDILEFTIAKN